MRRASILAIAALTFVLTDPAFGAVAPPSRQSAATRAVYDPPDTNLAAITEMVAAEADGEAAPLLDGTSNSDFGQMDDNKNVLPGELSADVTVISDFIIHSINYTDDIPAAQCSMSYSVDVGLANARPYVSFWGANTRVDDGEASTELDLGFGFSGTLANLEWNIGGFHHAFRGASSDLNYNYWDIPVQLSYAVDDHFSILGQYSYSPNFIRDSGGAHYLLVGARWRQQIHSMAFSIEGTTGHQWIDNNAAYGIADYQDWRAAAKLTFNLE